MILFNQVLSIFLLLIIIFLFMMARAAFKWIKIENRKTNISELAISAQLNAEKVVIESLDSLIRSSITEYGFANIENNTSFIFTEKTEYEITSIIGNMVLENMSKVMYNNLLIIYNENKLPEIITNRVYIYVVPYIADIKSELN